MCSRLGTEFCSLYGTSTVPYRYTSTGTPARYKYPVFYRYMCYTLIISIGTRTVYTCIADTCMYRYDRCTGTLSANVPVPVAPVLEPVRYGKLLHCKSYLYIPPTVLCTRTYMDSMAIGSLMSGLHLFLMYLYLVYLYSRFTGIYSMATCTRTYRINANTCAVG